MTEMVKKYWGTLIYKGKHIDEDVFDSISEVKEWAKINIVKVQHPFKVEICELHSDAMLTLLEQYIQE